MYVCMYACVCVCCVLAFMVLSALPFSQICSASEQVTWLEYQARVVGNALRPIDRWVGVGLRLGLGVGVGLGEGNGKGEVTGRCKIRVGELA